MRKSSLLLPVVLAFALAGCSVSVNATVPAPSLADQAADALQAQVGTAEAPELDCGDGNVDVTEGNVVDCVLTDPSTGTKFDATVTISNVKGTSYDIDVQVAETPLG